MKKLLIIFFALSLVIVGGCGSNSVGDKYVGKWECTRFEDGRIDLEITKNGEAFTLKNTVRSNNLGVLKETNQPATLTKDGMLSTGKEFASYDKDKDTILWTNETFTRVK